MYYQRDFNNQQPIPENGQVYYPNLQPQHNVQYGTNFNQNIPQNNQPQQFQPQQQNLPREQPREDPQEQIQEQPKSCKRKRRWNCLACCTFLCLIGAAWIGFALFFGIGGIRSGSREWTPDDRQCVLAERSHEYKDFTQRINLPVKSLNIVIPTILALPRHKITIKKSNKDGVRIYAQVQTSTKPSKNGAVLSVKTVDETATISFINHFYYSTGCPTFTLDIQVPESLKSIFINSTASTSVVLDSINSKDISINLVNRPAPSPRHINMTRVISENLQINAPNSRVMIRELSSEKPITTSIVSQSSNISNIENNLKLNVTASEQIDITKITNGEIYTKMLKPTTNVANPQTKITDVKSIIKVVSTSIQGSILYQTNHFTNTLFDLKSDKSIASIRNLFGIQWFRNRNNIKQGKIQCVGECINEVTLYSESGEVSFT